MQDKYENQELAKAVRTIYKTKLEQNLNNIKLTGNPKRDAMQAYNARIAAKSYARSIWFQIDMDRYNYLEKNYPIQSFDYYVEKYDGDYQKIIDGSTRTNKRFDNFAGISNT